MSKSRASRLTLAAVVLALLIGGGLAPRADGAQPATRLAITFWEDTARAGERTTWTLTCAPAGGSLPGARAVCRRFAAAGWERALRTPPKDVACSDLFGGSQAALVRGVVRGRTTWVRLARRNGCEIARWNSLAAIGLVPLARGPA